MSASSSPKLIQPLQPAQGGGGSGDSALRLALLGNPNCGKTALFNLLTGARQKVANYAGVTVERKERLAEHGQRPACARAGPAGHLQPACPQRG